MREQDARLSAARADTSHVATAQTSDLHWLNRGTCNMAMPNAEIDTSIDRED